MIFYAPRYMSPWKSTKDTVIPPGTTIHDNLQGALLWFVDNPYTRPKKRVPVILLFELEKMPEAFETHVRDWKRDATGSTSFRFRQRSSWHHGTSRILPTEEDFKCVITERQILDARSRPGVQSVLAGWHERPYSIIGTSVSLTDSWSTRTTTSTF